MKAKSEIEATVVRLQIPVSRELADVIAGLAKRMEWSQATMAAKLLSAAMENGQKLADWIGERVLETKPPRDRLGWLQMGNNSEVRLQVPIDAELAGRIDRLATRLNHTQVRMAALLLDFAVEDNAVILAFFGTRLGRGLLTWLGKVREEYESAEVKDDSDIEPEHTEKG